MSDLPPLPEPDMCHRKAPDDDDYSTAYSAEAMQAYARAAVAAERARWESAVAHLMPADFKDWHDSPQERPSVLASVLEAAYASEHLALGIAEKAKAAAVADERDRCEVLRHERDHARARLEHANKLLFSIHALLYPAPVKMADGRTMVFRPTDPDPHKVLQALSDRIRALPDEMDAAIRREPT